RPTPPRRSQWLRHPVRGPAVARRQTAARRRWPAAANPTPPPRPAAARTTAAPRGLPAWPGWAPGPPEHFASGPASAARCGFRAACPTVLRMPWPLSRRPQIDLAVDVLPQLADLLRRAAAGHRFHDGAAVDHRGGVIGALKQ